MPVGVSGKRRWLQVPDETGDYLNRGNLARRLKINAPGKSSFPGALPLCGTCRDGTGDDKPRVHCSASQYSYSKAALGTTSSSRVFSPSTNR